jgi:prevent-host-death family protein
MKFTNVRSLKMNTADLLREVEEGEEVVITYHGKPRAMLIRIAGDELALKESKRRQGILSRQHPFFKLVGKGADLARDVSANKYKYLSRAAGKKR